MTKTVLIRLHFTTRANIKINLENESNYIKFEKMG